ncbi:MAG TPA: cytochrome C oxidase subunit IV family protein [Candidatus Bipolaricaulota bacterium]
MAQQVKATEHEQHHPIGVYLRVWGLLFFLSILSYLVDYFEVQELAKRFLVGTFGLMKAGLIVSYFMHMRFERLSLIYAIVLPPLLLMTLLGILAAEGDNTAWLRQLFFR